MRAGTPPPCLRSSSSLPSASRMSACLKESFTSLCSSSKATTMYSIYNCQFTVGIGQPPIHASSPHQWCCQHFSHDCFDRRYSLKLIAFFVFIPLPYREQLFYPKQPHGISLLLGFWPCQWRPDGKKTHVDLAPCQISQRLAFPRGFRSYG